MIQSQVKWQAVIIGVVLGAGGYNTVANVTLTAQVRTGAATNGETGHYGLGAGGISQDNLFTHCALQTIFVHNLSVGAFADRAVRPSRGGALRKSVHRHPDLAERGRSFLLWWKPGRRAELRSPDDPMEHPVCKQLVPPLLPHRKISADQHCRHRGMGYTEHPDGCLDRVKARADHTASESLRGAAYPAVGESG